MSTQHQSKVSYNKSKKYCDSFVLNDSSSLNTTLKMNTLSITHTATSFQTSSSSFFKSILASSILKKIINSIFIITTLYILMLALSAVRVSLFNEINVEDFFKI